MPARNGVFGPNSRVKGVKCLRFADVSAIVGAHCMVYLLRLLIRNALQPLIPTGHTGELKQCISGLSEQSI
jgi:hypothetical protein